MRRLVLAVLLVLAVVGLAGNEHLLVRTKVPDLLPDPSFPEVARDMAPGAAIFEYARGTPVADGMLWPVLAVDRNSGAHVACLDSAGCLYYTGIPSWPYWLPPVRLADTMPEPGFPSHNIAASQVSVKVCVTWVAETTGPQHAYLRESTDGGETWQAAEELPAPPAFGGDTVTSFHISSLCPMYDYSDHLHIVAAVHPFVDDTAYTTPAAIWHWCPDNSPEWSLVHRASCRPENQLAPVGCNSLYACRPCIGMCWRGDYLLALWEQFDSSSAEPRTNLLRSGVCFSGSSSNGQYWDWVVRLTERDLCSYRFPSFLNSGYGDTARIVVLLDQCAGSFVLGEGPATANPVAAFIWTVPCDYARDTIGGTTYDQQVIGPSLVRTLYAPGFGVHAGWVFSASVQRTFPDLQFRYNFLDEATGSWNWIDPDYMQSGEDIYFDRVLGGSLASDPAGGVAMTCAWRNVPVGVEDKAEGGRMKAEPERPTVLRGAELLQLDCRVIDALGRDVTDRRERLAPGVYFIGEGSRGRGFEDSRVRKVIVQR